MLVGEVKWQVSEWVTSVGACACTTYKPRGGTEEEEEEKETKGEEEEEEEKEAAEEEAVAAEGTAESEDVSMDVIAGAAERSLV